MTRFTAEELDELIVEIDRDDGHWGYNDCKRAIQQAADDARVLAKVREWAEKSRSTGATRRVLVLLGDTR